MSKIKSSLKSKDGMALPMVLVVMLILTMFGTALYTLAWNSFMTVRYMNDQKKAYYFARAGVEFASYAYQVANVQAKDTTSAANSLITFSKSKGAIVKTNTIYVEPTPGEGTGKWKGLSFSRTLTPNAIGEITVEIGNGIDYVDVTDENKQTTQTENKVKAFRASAKSYVSQLEVDADGNVTNLGSMETVSGFASAYLSETETAKPLSFYDAKGVLKGPGYEESYTLNDVNVEEKESKFLKISKKVNINGTNIKPTSNSKFFLFRLLETLSKTIIKDIFVAIYGSEIQVDTYIKTADGNLILSKPTESSFIKTRENAHNYYIFETPDDLFLSNCGLNVVPTKGYYNSVGLYGDEIVIDGDIIMGVYYVKTSGFGTGISAIIETIGNRYRLGTVMLGEGSNGLTTRTDPLPIAEGGLQLEGKKVKANKVYFNGNVYVKIFNQGGATETYRIFNAGDMAYFYGGFTDSGSVDGKDVQAKGIDLLKYFLDAVIDQKEGFNYGSALIEKAKAINELYYTGTVSKEAYASKDKYSDTDPTPYFNDKTVLVRKIQVEYKNNIDESSKNKENVIVDGKYGSVLDLVQPSNIGATNIKWGVPEGGSVFNPIKNKQPSDY